jgi:transketolase
MRTAFIEQLAEEARKDDSVFLIVGDLGYSVVEKFAAEFPNQFLNAGIAEQNMTGIAAGLAMQGYCVFTYSIGNFPTLRCLEQIRYDVCYHNLNVKIVAVGGGYAYGPLGVSHHCTEDLGILRSIPNMTVCAPGDPYEAKAITALSVKKKGPCYIRLGKAGEVMVHKKSPAMSWGKALCIIEGNETAVLSTGAMLKYSEEMITKNKLGYGLYSFPFIKPLDYNLLIHIAKTYKSITTIEEHQKNTGFGSAVLEAFNDLREKKSIAEIPFIKRVAIPDIFIEVSGSQDHLRALAGLKL